MPSRILFPLILLSLILTAAPASTASSSISARSDATPAAPLTVERPRCEYRVDPLGIDVLHPRLGWWLRSAQRGEKQAAYQILVASSRDLLSQDQGDLWDSGRVASSESTLIPYGGKPLASLQQVFWKVRVWGTRSSSSASASTASSNSTSAPSPWSAPATWTMGLLAPEDWRAKWITFDTLPRTTAPKDRTTRHDDNTVQSDSSGLGRDKQGNPIPPLPLLRKAFTLDKPVKRAVVCVCGLGQYELSLNGARIGANQLDPGWTNYRKRCLYETCDVTAQLRPGANALGVMLGNGMYNVTGGRYTKFQGSFGPPKMILHLRVEFTDGTSTTIVSDETWKGAAGPVRFSCIYGGEDYDARLAQAGWDAPGFNDAAWRPVSVTAGPGGILAAQAQPPVRVMRELGTVKTTQPRPGIMVYDLGQNFSGWPLVQVKGPAGARVKLTPGELLAPDGLVSQRSSGGPTYFSYTLDGREAQWHPRFSFYGFRYVQVERTPAPGGSKLPQVLALGGQFLFAAVEPTGRFESANPILGRIHTLIDNAILSNMKSVLTDCPHREKLGWLEVSHLLGQAIAFDYDVPGFFAKICQDMAEAQLETGLVPDIAPEYTVFQGGFRDSPEWGSAAVIDPWLVYEMYGDASLLARHYEVMARYVDYLGRQAKDHIISYGLGDWYDIGPKGPGVSQLTSLGLTATAVWYQDVRIMERTAKILGKTADAAKYPTLAAAIREAFNKTYFHPETGSYDRDSQTASAMPLVLGLVPDAHRAAVTEHLVKNIREGGNRVTAGDVGFHYVVAALTEAGQGELLYDMVTQDSGPGYAYQLSKGATTLTEAWDTNPRSSQNHCMLGHAEEWFYRGLGGISPNGPGFRRITIRPLIPAGLASAHAGYDSIRGRIDVAWERKDGKLKMEITVPVGSAADIHIPANNAANVRESGKSAKDSAGVKFKKMEDGAAVFEVESGGYHFEIKE